MEDCHQPGLDRPPYLIVHGDVLGHDEVEQLREGVLGGGQPGGADAAVQQLSQPRLQLSPVRGRLGSGQVRSGQDGR